jgi:hypothetical protein
MKLRSTLALSTLIVVFAVLPAGAASAAPPANDAFADAVTVAEPGAFPADVTAAGTTAEATGQAGEPNPAGAGLADLQCSGPEDSFNAAPCQSSVWYTMTATETAPIVIQSCQLTGDKDTVLGVYTGSTVGSLTPVAQNDDDDRGCPGVSGESRVNFLAQAGTTYHILVAGYEGEQTGFTLHLTRAVDAPSIDRNFETPVDPHVTPLSFTIGSNFSVSCSFDGGSPEPCTSGHVYPASRFADGSHSVVATASGGGMTSDPSSPVDWVVDSVPAHTIITAGPADGDIAPNPVSYTIRSDADGAIECRIDGYLFGAAGGDCPGLVTHDTDYPVQLPDLCNGVHAVAFSVLKSTQSPDPSPATRSITITGGPTCQAPEFTNPHVQNITSTGAQPRADVDGHGAGTHGHIDWGDTAAYGSRLAEEDLGLEGTLGAFALHPLDFLTPNTTYHVRFVAENATGTTTTGDFEFTTLPVSGPPPEVTLGDPTDVTDTGATLHGTVASRQAPDIRFEYGTTTAYGNVTPTDSPGSGVAPEAAGLTGLQPGTTYHYRLAAASRGGLVHSADATFTTTGGSGSPPGPGPGSSPGGQNPPPILDRIAPVIVASGGTVRVTRGGAISFFATSNEDADGTATGTISLPKGAKVLRLAKRKVHLKAGKRTKITLKLSKKNAKRVRRALARHKRLKLNATLVLADKSGNRSSKRLKLKLKR